MMPYGDCGVRALNQAQPGSIEFESGRRLITCFARDSIAHGFVSNRTLRVWGSPMKSQWSVILYCSLYCLSVRLRQIIELRKGRNGVVFAIGVGLVVEEILLLTVQIG